jgi:uncharacterized membrane protein
MVDRQGQGDERFERFLATLLRSGVLLSALFVIAGGTVYLLRHHSETADYATFNETPELPLRTLSEIGAAVAQGRGRGIVQFGLLLLIATPVARVACSIAGFARQRDGTYVLLTLTVLAVLLYSLFLEGP